MNQKRRIVLLVALMCVGALGINFSQAQEGERPQRGERRQFDREEMRQRWEEMRQRRRAELMERLRIDDEDEQEFVAELINDVQAKQRNVSMYSMRGGFGRGGFGNRTRGGDRQGEAEDREVPEAVQHMNKLRELSEQEKPEEAEVKKALEEFRNARSAAEKELEKSRDTLREVLDARQQLVLVTMGLLD